MASLAIAPSVARATTRVRASARRGNASTARCATTRSRRERASTTGTASSRARVGGARDAMTSDTRGDVSARAIRDAEDAGEDSWAKSSRGGEASASASATGESFGNPNASGFSFGLYTSAGAKPYNSEAEARSDAARRLERLESLTQLRELYAIVVDCEQHLADENLVGLAGQCEEENALRGKPLSSFTVPSTELEEAMSVLEETVEILSLLEDEKQKLRSAGTLMDGKWEQVFSETTSARGILEKKFADCADRVEARSAEMAAYLPYSSCAEAERALEETRAAIEAAEEDQGEKQVGARLRPIGRRVGRFTSRRVRSAEGVLGEGIEALKLRPRQSLSNAANYSKGIWARINGVGDTGTVEALKNFPLPVVFREQREARILRLTIEVQDRDLALTEAQREREHIISQGRSAGALSRVALGDKVRVCDEKVTRIRRVFAVRTFQMEMERILLALEEEAASPPDAFSKDEIEDMRLMVAEFGVMDLTLRNMISLVDRQESELIDDEDLSKLAMEIPDMKLRLAINDEPNVAMSLDVARERMILTAEEALLTIREAGTFIVRGVRLLGSDIGASMRLFLRAAFGTTLRPREVQILRRTVLDIFTFVPFVIILITPITPVGHVLVFGFIQKYFPQLFPSQFTTRRQELMQKYEELKEQLAIAEEEADAANESAALRKAVEAVSSVRGFISGAVQDAAESITSDRGADVSEERMQALRAELDETELRLSESIDDSASGKDGDKKTS